MGALRDSGQGGQIAAQSLFTASAAANAIPVAGQFASAGLAIAGMFTKIFAGRRQRKRRAAEAERQRRGQEATQSIKATVGPAAAAAGGMGLSGGMQQGTQPVYAPRQTSFNAYGGGAAPSTQNPTQQVITNSLGMSQ